MKVRAHATLSEADLQWLHACGTVIDPAGDVLVRRFRPGEGPISIDTGSEEDPLPVVALVDSPEEVDSAIQAGATDVIVGRPSSPELLARLGSHRRMARTWRRRMQQQQRRATRAHAELASTQDLLGRLIDATPNPVMAVDIKGRVVVFNRAAEKALGYDTEYARTHMRVTDIYADASDARRILAEMRATETGLVQGISVRLRARWGEQIPVELSAAEVHDAEGGLIATVGVFQDMREQVALRNRLEATTEQLIAAEQRAAAIELAGEAAYEINQPLTALLGTMELLEMEPDLSDRSRTRLQRAQGHLQRIREAVRALARTSRPRGPAADNGGRMAELTRDGE